MFKRTLVIHNAQFELFWSYKKWFAGDTDLGYEILANMAMFIPFGFLCSAVYPANIHYPSFICGGRKERTKSGRKAAVVIVSAILFSLAIETLQLVLMRGLFEWDDVISNTVGVIIGLLLYSLVKRWKYVPMIISAIFTITCLAVAITGHNVGGVEADITPRLFCFQVEDSVLQDGELNLSGFAFRYDHETRKPTIILRSTETGKRITLDTEQVARPDVNEYFACEYDYSYSGFNAFGRVDDQEYEILIRWPWSVALSTGVYIDSNTIRYSPAESFRAPDTSDAPDLKEIVEDGVPRVYRPDYHCWVYQKGWSLYWIVDQDFNFEDDGSTYIQYQLNTTQKEKLPQKRIENGWFWDNIGGHFEKYELTGNFGSYRVMRREIPTAYSVTSIETGYYKNGEWIWKNFFRPVYKFEGGES